MSLEVMSNESLLLSLEGIKTSVCNAECQIVEFTETLLVAFVNSSGTEDDLEDEVVRLTEAIRQLKEIVAAMETKIRLKVDAEDHFTSIEVKEEVDLDVDDSSSDNGLMYEKDPLDLSEIENVPVTESECASSSPKLTNDSQYDYTTKSDQPKKSCRMRKPKLRRCVKSGKTKPEIETELRSSSGVEDQLVSCNKKINQKVNVSLIRLSEGLINTTTTPRSAKLEDGRNSPNNRGKRVASQKAIEMMSQMKHKDEESSSSSDEGLDEDEDDEWGGSIFDADESSSELVETLSVAETKPLVLEIATEGNDPRHGRKENLKPSKRTYSEEMEKDSTATSDLVDNNDNRLRKLRKLSKNTKQSKKSQKQLSCFKCGMIYLTKSNLDNHLKRHEDPNAVHFKCSFCPKSFLREFHLTIHNRSHGKCHDCPHCDRFYSNAEAVKLHVKEKHVVQTDPTEVVKTCPFCLQEGIYKDTRSFINHQNRCARSIGNLKHPVKGPWKCPKSECADRSPFSDFLKFRFHLKKGIHPTSPEEDDKKLIANKEFFNCPKCTESIESKCFHNHIRSCVCAGDKTNEVSCPSCQKVFKNLTTLVNHLKLYKIKESLDPEISLPCSKCSSSFTMEKHLKAHLKLVHTTAQPFLCSKCPSTFKYKSVFKKHMERIHPEGPIRDKFVCDQCGQTFADNYLLKKHLTCVHQGLRPHSCDMCDKSFKQKTHLNYHRKTHERPNSKTRSLNKPRLVPVSRSKKQAE